MLSKLAQSIRTARIAAGLTQKQLGMRLGLKGRAVYRWERDDSAPTKRNQRALVTAIRAVNMQAASALAAAITTGGAPPPPAPVAAPPAAPTGPVALELAIFHAADELDLPPRRIRGALARLLKRMRAAGFTLETAQQQLDVWIATS